MTLSPLPMRLTMAEPTTTPSATSAMAFRFFGGVDAKAHDDRQAAGLLNADNLGGHVIGICFCGTGDAGDGDVVDKTGGVLDHHARQAFVIRGGGCQTDEVQPRGLVQAGTIRCLLRGASPR